MASDKRKSDLTYKGDRFGRKRVPPADATTSLTPLSGVVYRLRRYILLRWPSSIIGRSTSMVNKPAYFCCWWTYNEQYSSVEAENRAAGCWVRRLRNSDFETDYSGRHHPEDIESLTVLKGHKQQLFAAPDGANGAIIITTKRSNIAPVILFCSIGILG